MTDNDVILWTAFAEWLGNVGFWFRSGEGLEMQERLFALPKRAVTIPEVDCRWLPRVGLRGGDASPHPLVAYRLNPMHQRFRREPWSTMNELLALASAVPGKVRLLRAVPTRTTTALC